MSYIALTIPSLHVAVHILSIKLYFVTVHEKMNAYDIMWMYGR